MLFAELKVGQQVKYQRCTELMKDRAFTDKTSVSGIGTVSEIYKHHVLLRKGIRKISISRNDMFCGDAKLILA